MPTVAVLLAGTADDTESVTMVSAFEQGMRLAGWTKDANVHLDYRWGGTDPQQAASTAAEVAALKPDVVVAIGSPVVVAMQRVCDYSDRLRRRFRSRWPTPIHHP